MDLEVGKFFHNFKIIKECGTGGYGKVYLVEDILERRVALKVVEKQVSTDSWEREWRGLKTYARNISFSHPELIAIYYAGEDDNLLYYTMEPADNLSNDPDSYIASTLERRLQKKRRLKNEEVFAIADHLLNAIETLHSFGLTHRDIKPANILYVNGKLKLGDIGLISDAPECSMVGTRPFLPPEKSDNSKLTQADDFYALGKTLYTLFTGLAAEKYPALSNETTFSESSKRLNNFIRKLAAQNPEDRISDLVTIRSLLTSARQEFSKAAHKSDDKLKSLINHLHLSRKWDSNDFDDFLRHLLPVQKESLKITLGLVKDQKFSSVSAEETEIKKQLLWHYSTLFAYPFKSNEVPYHEIVKWIAEKKGVRKRELLVYNTFQLECRIFDKLLLMPDEKEPVTTSLNKLLEQVSKTTEYLQETDLNRVTQTIILFYNIKREVIEQYYDELPEKPKYPRQLKREAENA